MSHDDLTPERLDALIDGAEPANDDERDVLHLAAALRSGSPRPSDDLKRRVRALGEPPRAVPPRRRLRWSVLTPALGALVAAVIATTVVLTRSPNDSTSAATEDAAVPTLPATSTGLTGGAAPGATFQSDASATASPRLPGAPTWVVSRGSLDDVITRIDGLVSAANGSYAVTDEESGKLVTITVDPQRRADLTRVVVALVAQRQSKDATPAAELDPAAPFAFHLREAP